MRIGIDGRTIVHGKTGVGTYAQRLVRSLLRIDKTNEYILYLVEPDPNLTAQNLITVVQSGISRMGVNRYWENIILPRELRRSRIDLFFSPAYALPFTTRFRLRKRSPSSVRSVVTIHDLIGFIHPESFTPKMRLWQKFFVSNAAAVADCIIAVSESTKRDLLRLCGIEEKRVVVVHNAVDDLFQPVAERENLDLVRRRYNLPEQFILSVGTIEPRKNIVQLARAYTRLPRDLRQEYALVIAGGTGWKSEAILQDLAKLSRGHRIKLIGYVEQDHLPALYTLAAVLAFPSLYEGFGYPPLEAMACGTPVVASNVSSIPEVAGDAAILIDPYDDNGLVHALQEVLENDGLREKLRRKGAERARLFNWRRQAEETLRVFVNTAAGEG